MNCNRGMDSEFSPLMKGGVSGGLERCLRQPPPNLPLDKGEETPAESLVQGNRRER